MRPEWPTGRHLHRATIAWWQHRFAIIFVVGLSTLAGRPLLAALANRSGVLALQWSVRVLDAILFLALLVGIVGIVRGRARTALLVVGLAGFVARSVGAGARVTWLEASGESTWILACVLGIVACARRAFRPGAVDRERIFAALDAYLLAGVAFGAVYWMLELTWMDSFGAADTVDLTRSKAGYFSFVTLATLGYGDIVPASDVTRGLATLEAVAGQTYLAVLVARLVSLYGSGDGGTTKAR